MVIAGMNSNSKYGMYLFSSSRLAWLFVKKSRLPEGHTRADEHKQRDEHVAGRVAEVAQEIALEYRPDHVQAARPRPARGRSWMKPALRSSPWFPAWSPQFILSSDGKWINGPAAQKPALCRSTNEPLNRH